MAAPWSLAVRDEAPLTVLAVVRGATWLDADGVSARLAPGDVAVLRRQPSYTVADEPRRPLQAVILPGQGCAAPGGRPPGGMGPGRGRAGGNAARGAAGLLSGPPTTGAG